MRFVTAKNVGDEPYMSYSSFFETTPKRKFRYFEASSRIAAAAKKKTGE
jgi:hypothetical protein